MLVDNASRLQRPYGTREKSAVVIFSVVKCFVADTGVPRALHTDNGTGYLNMARRASRGASICIDTTRCSYGGKK